MLNLVQIGCFGWWLSLAIRTGPLYSELCEMVFFLGASSPTLFVGLFMQTKKFERTQEIQRNALFFLTHLLLLLPGAFIVPLVFRSLTSYGVVDFISYLIMPLAASFASLIAEILFAAMYSPPKKSSSKLK